MPNLIGTAPDQVPVNGFLGNMAFQNKESVITDLLSTTALTVTGTGVMSVGGTQIFKNTNGNVGIGTGTPARTLEVNGSIRVANANRVEWGGDQYYIAGDTAGAMIFGAAGPERMRITSAGSVGIGTSSPAAQQTLTAGRNMTGSTFSSGVASTGQVQSDATSRADYFISVSSVAAGTYSRVVGYQAQQGTITGTVNNQYGFQADATLIGATYNMGFFGNIPDGTNRWNFYAQGTAPNYFAGNVGIGTTSPGAKLVVSEAGTGFLSFAPANAATSAVMRLGYNIDYSQISADSFGGNLFIGADESNTKANSYIAFRTDAAEKMRIDSSGNLLVGTTTLGGTNGFSIDRVGINGVSVALWNRTARATTSYPAIFRDNSVDIGYISYTNTAVTYNTTSDVRLKHDIVDAPEASSLIDAIQVRSFKWNVDDSEQRYGFVAQELVTVAPEAVSQPEDPEGMMAVDYSKLVPMLVKEIQSLRARVAQLEGN